MLGGNRVRHGQGAFGRLQNRVTRRGLVTGIGLAGAGALTTRAPLLRSAARERPAVQNVIDSAITAEAFAVTLLGVAQQRSDRIGLTDDVLRFVRAAQCEEEAHYHFFEAAGAKPATTRFSIASSTFPDPATFLRTLANLEAIFVAGYMAAARQFAALGELRLVEIAYQIGAVEAQHLAVTRVFLGEALASDRAFAQWRFGEIAQAGQALADAGFIGGKGHAYPFPGPVDRICRGVAGLVPETTDDQAAAAASPVATTPVP